MGKGELQANMKVDISICRFDQIVVKAPARKKEQISKKQKNRENARAIYVTPRYTNQATDY